MQTRTNVHTYTRDAAARPQPRQSPSVESVSRLDTGGISWRWWKVGHACVRPVKEEEVVDGAGRAAV